VSELLFESRPIARQLEAEPSKDAPSSYAAERVAYGILVAALEEGLVTTPQRAIDVLKRFSAPAGVLGEQWLDDQDRRQLLYIEPKSMPAEKPVIDDLTLRMVGALRNARMHGIQYCGIHRCVCGALSHSSDRIWPNGWITNTLCVHYLAYHRAEVPASDLDAVRTLPPGTEMPTSLELHGPKNYNADKTRAIRLINAQRDRFESRKQRRLSALLGSWWPPWRKDS